jgi:mannose-6-phosphate isomerase
LDDEKVFRSAGESITIPLGAKHRIINETEDILVFIEVQTGTYFGEDDIIRLEDDYGRED